MKCCSLFLTKGLKGHLGINIVFQYLKFIYYMGLSILKMIINGNMCKECRKRSIHMNFYEKNCM